MDFFEEDDESSAEDVEEDEDTPEQVVHALLSELIDRIEEEEPEQGEKAKVQDSLDDFIVQKRNRLQVMCGVAREILERALRKVLCPEERVRALAVATSSLTL